MKAIVRRGRVTGKPISALPYTEESIERIAKQICHSPKQVRDALSNEETIGGNLSAWSVEDWVNKKDLEKILLR